MTIENENAICEAINFESNDINLDDLEQSLEAQLKDEFDDLDALREESEHINNPDSLVETVMTVVWDQFVNQVAYVAGEDFIRENRGLTLDLRNDAHIQTAENFAEGKIAEHNYKSKDKLEHNYERYTQTPHKEFRKDYVNPGMDAALKRAGVLKKQGIDTVTDIYTGKQIPTETKLPNGKNNPEAAQREHVKSSAELYKNASLQMANSDQELADIINDPKNLQGYTTAARNNRKSDKSATEMDECDKTKHWEKANAKAEEHVNKTEKKGEERLKKEGRKTQKEEAFRIGGKALRTEIVTLLSDLLKKIIVKLISWLRSAEKSIHTLVEHIKTAVKSFINGLGGLLIDATEAVITTIASAIINPAVGMIKKTIILIKQGWTSLRKAVQYLRAPENRGKPLSSLLPQVGEIVIAGLTGIGAIVLGEFIEKALIAVLPPLAVEIPLLGSPANLIGMLMGAIVCGIIGAIAINLIEKHIAKQQKNDNLIAQIDKKNEILQTSGALSVVKIANLSCTKQTVAANVVARHVDCTEKVRDVCDEVFKPIQTDTQENIRRNRNALDELLQM